MFPRYPPLCQTPPPPASTSVHPSVFPPSALSCSNPEPTFVHPIILAPSDIARPDTDPASVYFETARHLASASANCAATRSSGLLAPQLSSTQLQTAPKTRSFIVPDPVGSELIAYLTIITGAAMSSALDINTFIKGCQCQTVTALPPSDHHPAMPILQSLKSLGLPAAVGKPWSLDTI